MIKKYEDKGMDYNIRNKCQEKESNSGKINIVMQNLWLEVLKYIKRDILY